MRNRVVKVLNIELRKEEVGSLSICLPSDCRSRACYRCTSAAAAVAADTSKKFGQRMLHQSRFVHPCQPSCASLPAQLCIIASPVVHHCQPSCHQPSYSLHLTRPCIKPYSFKANLETCVLFGHLARLDVWDSWLQ